MDTGEYLIKMAELAKWIADESDNKDNHIRELEAQLEKERLHTSRCTRDFEFEDSLPGKSLDELNDMLREKIGSENYGKMQVQAMSDLYNGVFEKMREQLTEKDEQLAEANKAKDEARYIVESFVGLETVRENLHKVKGQPFFSRTLIDARDWLAKHGGAG